MEHRATLAVLGGGQLGRMLGLAAIPLGVQCRFLDPSPDAPAGAVGELVVGRLDDERALADVARDADVVTYEWEGVPAESARLLSAIVPVRPGDRPLAVSQDRLREKEVFRRIGIPTTAFHPVDAREDLDVACARIGGPTVLKTRQGGYDGKGQTLLRSAADLDPAWATLGGQPLIAEAFVPFARELSIVAARGIDGTIVGWPVVENEHRDGILRVTRAPATGVTPAQEKLAREMAISLMTELDHVGVLAIELFDLNGTLVANEFAPRVHNSGHWTIEGAVTSQFENHLRAVLGLPLGATDARGVSAMVNCIGTMPDADAVLAVPGTHLHDYGKEPRPGRKLGHVTATADSSATLDSRLATLLPLL